MIQLTVMTREGCHLCDKMATELVLMQKKLPFQLAFVDIDEKPELLAQYNADVPVVMMDNTVLFRHFFDEDRLRQALVHG